MSNVFFKEIRFLQLVYWLLQAKTCVKCHLEVRKKFQNKEKQQLANYSDDFQSIQGEKTLANFGCFIYVIA